MAKSAPAAKPQMHLPPDDPIERLYHNLEPGQLERLFKGLPESPAPAPKRKAQRSSPWRRGMVAAGRGPVA